MRDLRYVFSLLVSTLMGYAQENLVPNPSFEEYSDCPTSHSQINKAVGWDTHLHSEEFYHSCASFYTIPQNPLGNQCPVTGIGYSGLIAYNPLGVLQESFGRQLSNSIQIGQKYYVSMKVSLAEWSGSASDKLGILFSTINYNDTMPPPINNFAHIYTEFIISDTLEWTTISGVFIADSAYQYISIGTFFDDANIDTIVFNPNKDGTTYYFIDDICVSTDSIVCLDITNKIIDFSADSLNMVEGDCINFNLNTLVDYDFYTWQFDGGQPNSSSENLPTNICYDASGIYPVTLIASDSSGCADTILKNNYIKVDSKTFVDENISINPIQIYPNPFDEVINIELDHRTNSLKHLSIGLYDVLGRKQNVLLTTKQSNDIIQIEAPNLPKGIYHLMIQTDHKITSRKLVHY